MAPPRHGAAGLITDGYGSLLERASAGYGSPERAGNEDEASRLFDRFQRHPEEQRQQAERLQSDARALLSHQPGHSRPLQLRAENAAQRPSGAPKKVAAPRRVAVPSVRPHSPPPAAPPPPPSRAQPPSARARSAHPSRGPGATLAAAVEPPSVPDIMAYLRYCHRLPEPHLPPTPPPPQPTSPFAVAPSDAAAFSAEGPPLRGAEPTLEGERRRGARPRTRCGECAGCSRADCGACGACLDKVKFGGTNSRKAACKQRTCLLMVQAQKESREAAAKLKAASAVDPAQKRTESAVVPHTKKRAAEEDPALTTARLMGQCERNHLCTRGFRHLGKGGHCALPAKKRAPRRRPAAAASGGSSSASELASASASASAAVGSAGGRSGCDVGALFGARLDDDALLERRQGEGGRVNPPVRRAAKIAMAAVRSTSYGWTSSDDDGEGGWDGARNEGEEEGRAEKAVQQPGKRQRRRGGESVEDGRRALASNPAVASSRGSLGQPQPKPRAPPPPPQTPQHEPTVEEVMRCVFHCHALPVPHLAPAPPSPPPPSTRFEEDIATSAASSSSADTGAAAAAATSALTGSIGSAAPTLHARPPPRRPQHEPTVEEVMRFIFHCHALPVPHLTPAPPSPPPPRTPRSDEDTAAATAGHTGAAAAAAAATSVSTDPAATAPCARPLPPRTPQHEPTVEEVMRCILHCHALPVPHLSPAPPSPPPPQTRFEDTAIFAAHTSAAAHTADNDDTGAAAAATSRSAGSACAAPHRAPATWPSPPQVQTGYNNELLLT